jgi:hypothetical protein
MRRPRALPVTFRPRARPSPTVRPPQDAHTRPSPSPHGHRASASASAVVSSNVVDSRRAHRAHRRHLHRRRHRFARPLGLFDGLYRARYPRCPHRHTHRLARAARARAARARARSRACGSGAKAAVRQNSNGRLPQAPVPGRSREGPRREQRPPQSKRTNARVVQCESAVQAKAGRRGAGRGGAPQARMCRCSSANRQRRRARRGGGRKCLRRIPRWQSTWQLVGLQRNEGGRPSTVAATTAATEVGTLAMTLT